MWVKRRMCKTYCITPLKAMIIAQTFVYCKSDRSSKNLRKTDCGRMPHPGPTAWVLWDQTIKTAKMQKRINNSNKSQCLLWEASSWVHLRSISPMWMTTALIYRKSGARKKPARSISFAKMSSSIIICLKKHFSPLFQFSQLYWETSER